MSASPAAVRRYKRRRERMVVELFGAVVEPPEDA
jgi:hypothetical protein